MGSGLSWAFEAEKRVLGNVLEHSQEPPRVVDVVADRLSVDDFSTLQHAAVYEAVVELLEESEPVTLAHVVRRLQARRSPVDGLGEALGLIVEHAYPRYGDQSLLGQVKLIRSASRARKTRKLGQDLVEAAAVEDDDGQALQEAQERMLRLTREDELEEADAEGPHIEQAAERLRQAGKEDRTFQRTGLRQLDSIFPTGVAPRTLTVIAALSSRGKSTLTMQVADHIALQMVLRIHRGLVRFLSLEMGRVELHRRRLIALTGIPMAAWLGRDVLPYNADTKLEQAVLELKARPISVRYAGTMSLAQVKALARRDAHGRGLALLVVDYLQLLQARRRGVESRVQEVGAVAYGLKAIAMDHDVPVLTVSQLNRAAAGNPTPRLSDLRESGDIEHAADNVLFVYQAPKDGDNVVRMRMGKQRNGPRDIECKAFFDGALFRFEELADDGEEKGAS